MRYPTLSAIKITPLDKTLPVAISGQEKSCLILSASNNINLHSKLNRWGINPPGLQSQSILPALLKNAGNFLKQPSVTVDQSGK